VNILLPLAALLLLASYAESAQQFIKQKQVTLSSWSFNGAQSLNSNYEDLYFNLGVTITNPSSFSLQVNYIQANVIYNNTVVGTFTRSTPFTINANGSTVISALADVNAADLENALPGAVNSIITGGKVPVTIQGTVSTSLADIDYSINANV